MITTVRTKAENDIKTAETKLGILNIWLVTHIRAQTYQERMHQGWKPDHEASMWLHVHPLGLWGDPDRIDICHNLIQEAIAIKRSSERFIAVYDDAMHKAMHEVIGECMYQWSETYNYDTSTWDPLLSQPCDVWGLK